MQAVIGASGLIGGYLLRTLKRRGIEAVGTSRSGGGDLRTLDLLDSAGISRFVHDHRPNAVYLAAAQTNVDEVERNPSAARRANIDAPTQLLDSIGNSGTRVVFFSSDYVFDGADGPYSEGAAPAPLNEYGAQKLELERLASSYPNSIILRVTHVFGAEERGKNFGVRCLANLRAGTAMTLPSDQYATPTHASIIAEAAIDLVNAGASGLFHVAGSTVASRDEWASAMARAFDLDPSPIIPTPTSQLNQHARRPLRAGLLCPRAEALLGREFPSLTEQLDIFKRELEHG